MGHTGRKFHLKFSECVRALTRNHDGDETGAEDEQYSENDRQIALPHVFDCALERSRSMPHDKLPGFADKRALETAAGPWASAPAANAWRPRRAKKVHRCVGRRDVLRPPFTCG